jgi:hypothetical protein
VDPVFLFTIEKSIFLLPVVVSLSTLVSLWRREALYGRLGTGFCLWFVLATVTQFLGGSVGVWAVGLVGQVALAIVLILKKRIDDIR